ncbi:uncharacterized protein K452DRAFT_361175 [Aplosporella prunicola CBS 121167]|uniref:dipeptidyl-peptidase IV n=1 Tax=Aplosporella prunicola CBS 121167 TaxID=1176127 RepID=A0A6A6B5E6_9PEZI|nr:uncharacterized protein K452DRAFT_361175 [Aplosporella prunicola CBS 121167]KAF2138495.1 hypothetical protein K452DRAFT_361175 [Aplosporella prunicola CBS 121167]
MQFLLLLTLVIASFVNAITPARSPDPPTGSGTRLLTFNESLFDFSTHMDYYPWVATDEDGQCSYANDAGLVIYNLATDAQKVLIPADKLPAGYSGHWLKPDLTKVLWATNKKMGPLTSFTADYFVQDVSSGTVEPLVKDQAGDIQYAQWNPKLNNIALSDSVATQITADGGSDLLYTIPDWMYQEEVFQDSVALWFSPDGKHLAYLSLNESGVTENKLSKGNPPQVYEDYRCPKAGEKIPEVGLHILDVSSAPMGSVHVDEFPMDDMIIGEVTWVTDDHSNVLVRAFNRVQDQEKIFNVDVQSGKISTVRERTVSEGWIDNIPDFTDDGNHHYLTYLGHVSGASTDDTYYLGMSDMDGWNHLVLWPVHGGDSKPLTSGEWEVLAVLKVDTTRKMVYYTSNEHHSTESHVYSISYETGTKTPLVDDTVAAYWTASFTPGSSYYVLSYEGPDVPYQELYSVDSTKPLKTLISNEELYNTLQEFKLPRTTYFELTHPSGYTLNVMQRLPADFDPARKYPVLFTPYGGPGVQKVRKKFPELNWFAYMSSDPEYGYATWTVDGRGTPNKGRAFRSPIKNQLGKLEADDQIWAAQKLLADNAWADPAHVAIFGEGYGAYLALKVVEANNGVFTLGLGWAPVTDWRFYNSFYAERYMGLPAENADGYAAAAVKRPEGFKNIAGNVMIIQGAADDNTLEVNINTLKNDMTAAGVRSKKLETYVWDTGRDFLAETDREWSFVKHQAFEKRLYDEKRRVAK